MSGRSVRSIAFFGAAVAFGAALVYAAVLQWPPAPLARGVVLGLFAGGFGASAFWLGVTIAVRVEPRAGGDPRGAEPRSPHAVSPEEAKRLLRTFLTAKKPPP